MIYSYLDTDKLSMLDQHQLSILQHAVNEEVEKRFADWDKYIAYLRQWADDNADPVYAGQSPVCYDEWRAMEDNQNE